MTTALVIAGIIVCILLSAYFSGSEMALSSFNHVRMENEAEKGDKKAKRSLFLSEHYDDALSSILIGNNLVNIAASSLTTVLIILLTGSDSLNWVGTVVMTVLIIIFGETIPKIFCKRNANKMAMASSWTLQAVRILLKPVSVIVVFLVKLITKPIRDDEDEDDSEESVEELQSIIDTAEDEGVLDSDRSEMISAAIDFSDISADEVMTARVDVQAIDIDDDRENIIAAAVSSSHSRMPVYEGTIDHIIGMVHLNHLLKALSEDENADIRSLLMKPCYVYRTMKLPRVLDTLKRNRQHLAVVTDEYFGTLGVITMEDVLEQIVGDIWDETDIVEEEVVQVAEDEFEIDGDMSIDDFLELAGIAEDDFDFESTTVGGWVIEYNGDFPREGAVLNYRDLTVRVLKMDELRVEKVRVTRNKNEEEA